MSCLICENSQTEKGLFVQDVKIVIAGFAGAGKSTFLTALEVSSPADWKRFSDLDSETVSKSGHQSVSELVAEMGWERFRELEQIALREWLDLPGNGVLALGGGSLTQDSLEMIQSRPEVQLLYMHADFETCWERIKESGETRPLVQRGKEELQSLYEKRSLLFEKIPLRIENSSEAHLEGLAREFWSRLRG